MMRTSAQATASGDDANPVIRLWDLRSSTTMPLGTLRGHSQGLLSVSWCPDDPSLLASCGRDNRTLVWDLFSTEAVYELPAAASADPAPASPKFGQGGASGGRAESPLCFSLKEDAAGNADAAKIIDEGLAELGRRSFLEEDAGPAMPTPQKSSRLGLRPRPSSNRRRFGGSPGFGGDAQAAFGGAAPTGFGTAAAGRRYQVAWAPSTPAALARAGTRPLEIRQNFAEMFRSTPAPPLQRKRISTFGYRTGARDVLVRPVGADP